ncbi:hypothetical protein ACFSHQ_18310 [Gemmobacter lanyuensis]
MVMTALLGIFMNFMSDHATQIAIGRQKGKSHRAAELEIIDSPQP